MDFEIDSIHRESLWCFLTAYGIPQQIILVIKSFYNNFKCRVWNSESSFKVDSGVRQGCSLSVLVFNLTTSWVIRQTTSDQPWGIRWTLFSTLAELDFANDLVLVSQTHQQEKITCLCIFAQQLDMKINQKIVEVMMLNVPNLTPIKENRNNLLTTE